jgi:hypothetical protein
MPNPYDRILKENIIKIVLTSSKETMMLDIVSHEVLKDKLQSTKERETDFIGIVEIMENGQKVKKILHLEFETTMRDIHERNMDYHAMIARKYKKMEIAHYVLYIGQGEPSVSPELEEAFQYRGFTLLRYRYDDAERFLQSQIPETVLMALLCDVGSIGSALEMAHRILARLHSICDKEEIIKYHEQFLTLSRLNFKSAEDHQILSDMALTINYDYKKDPFYIKGIQESIAEITSIKEQWQEEKRMREEEKRMREEEKRMREEEKAKSILAAKEMKNLGVSDKRLTEIFDIQLKELAKWLKN